MNAADRIDWGYVGVSLKDAGDAPYSKRYRGESSTDCFVCGREHTECIMAEMLPYAHDPDWIMAYLRARESLRNG